MVQLRTSIKSSVILLLYLLYLSKQHFLRLIAIRLRLYNTCNANNTLQLFIHPLLIENKAGFAIKKNAFHYINL